MGNNLEYYANISVITDPLTHQSVSTDTDVQDASSPKLTLATGVAAQSWMYVPIMTM
jgi:hypothetical protein